MGEAVRVIGATPHLAMRGLDEGPIIAARAVNLSAAEDFGSIKRKGARWRPTCSDTVQLYFEKWLDVRLGCGVMT